ncbi:MAG: methyltransferase domain-containing protein [Bacteroidetes bacterium]|jgi:tRNA (cmo5U34)-methyltransferase|nr:methyltransferase domain-containing protein [Bacteroidota bacterium]
MKKVEIFENERATRYNQFVENWIPNYHYFLDQLPKLLREADPKSLLVVGCGTGNEIDRFVEAPENWSITGVDPSPEMIQQAREKLNHLDDVTLIEGLITDLDQQQTFGAATLLLVLHFLADNGEKSEILKAIADRLRPGAPFVLLDITGNRNQIRDNLDVLKSLLPDDLDDETISYRLHRIEHELHHISEERLTEIVVEAGFEPPLRFFQSSIYVGWLMHKQTGYS